MDKCNPEKPQELVWAAVWLTDRGHHLAAPHRPRNNTVARAEQVHLHGDGGVAGVDVFVNTLAAVVDAVFVEALRQLFPEDIADDELHRGTGFVFVAPVVKLDDLPFDPIQQFRRDGLQLFDLLRRERLFEEFSNDSPALSCTRMFSEDS